MVQKTDTSEKVLLPADYQQNGGEPVEAEDTEPDTEDQPTFGEADYVPENLLELPEATIEDWLLDPEPVEEWVRLKTRPMRVLLRALTEEVRQDINRRAPRKVDKRTKKLVPDQDWINMEIVKRSLVRPKVTDNAMLKKSLAGDLAHLAGEIGRISGFDTEGGGALE